MSGGWVGGRVGGGWVGGEWVGGGWVSGGCMCGWVTGGADRGTLGLSEAGCERMGWVRVVATVNGCLTRLEEASP